MTENDKQRLIPLFRASKQGRPESAADSRFVLRMFRLYPKEYGAIQRETAGQVMREVNPFDR